MSRLDPARTNRARRTIGADSEAAVNTTSSAHDLAGASRVRLPPGPWPSVLDCLCALFPAIGREVWCERFTRGRVRDAQARALDAATPHRAQLEVYYFREVPDEAELPFDETLLHVDAHLVVADKPHFLPVIPAGRFVEQTLLRRLMRRLGNPDLVPLHRIDRATAGLVLFSAHPATRAAYQALFRERWIDKRYLAVAARLDPLPALRRSRLVPGEPFFRMAEVEGEANSETRITQLCARGALAGYALQPVTGRKHQLRVHMAALGAPILHDPLYPQLGPEQADDFTRPLQLLAETLAFVDPLTQQSRRFHSTLRLQHWPD